MADPATHLGEINNIVATGHIVTWNFYPAAHIYAAEISSISGIDPIVLRKVIPLVFALLYVSFMYLLAKSLLADKAAVILATVASLSLTLGWYIEFLPNGLANFVFPLALFLLIKSFTAGFVYGPGHLKEALIKVRNARPDREEMKDIYLQHFTPEKFTSRYSELVCQRIKNA